MIPPPTFTPRSNLIQGFAAPQWDSRFHTQTPLREHTVAGLLIEAWARAKQHPEEAEKWESTVAFIQMRLEYYFPDVLRDLTEAMK